MGKGQRDTFQNLKNLEWHSCTHICGISCQNYHKPLIQQRVNSLSMFYVVLHGSAQRRSVPYINGTWAFPVSVNTACFVRPCKDHKTLELLHQYPLWIQLLDNPSDASIFMNPRPLLSLLHNGWGFLQISIINYKTRVNPVCHR